MFLKFLFNLDDKTYRDTHRPPAAVSAVFLSQLLLVSAREKKVKKKERNVFRCWVWVSTGAQFNKEATKCTFLKL